jgi:uncharacterized protein with PIN domain
MFVDTSAIVASDYLSYACAKAHGAALLFRGEDFAATDIARA